MSTMRERLREAIKDGLWDMYTTPDFDDVTEITAELYRRADRILALVSAPEREAIARILYCAIREVLPDVSLDWYDTNDPDREYCLAVADEVLALYAAPPDTKRLREALEAICEMWYPGNHIDGGDFQDAMVKHGVLVEVPATDEFRAEWDAETMYVVAWSPLATAALEGSDG